MKMLKLTETLLDNCQNGQMLIYRDYCQDEGHEADNIIYLVEQAGQDQFHFTEIYLEDTSDSGGYSNHPHDPVSKMLNRADLQDKLENTISDTAKILKGGLPFLFRATNEAQQDFDLSGTINQESPYRRCVFFSYLTRDPFWVYPFGDANLKNYVWNLDEDLMNKQVCSNFIIDYLSSQSLADMPRNPPFLLLNNRYLLYKEKEFTTLLAHDDNRVEYRIVQTLDDDLYHWLVTEKSSGQAINLGIINKNSGHHIGFVNENVDTDSHIYQQFKKFKNIYS